MNRLLQNLNGLGVAALTALCVLQWRTNRQLNLEGFELEKTRLEQAAKLEERDKTIQGGAADLDGFRERLIRANTALRDSETRRAGAEHDAQHLVAERDQLKASVALWVAAVATRDERLKEADDRLQDSANDRNEAVGRFNDLADKYNSVVQELNEARTRLAASQTNSVPSK